MTLAKLEFLQRVKRRAKDLCPDATIKLALRKIIVELGSNTVTIEVDEGCERQVVFFNEQRADSGLINLESIDLALQDLEREARPPINPSMTAEEVIQSLLERFRSSQGGHDCWTGKGWSYIATTVWLEASEVSALFAIAGVKPEVTPRKGVCADCAHSKNGHERGYSHPCSGCRRPRMSNFLPKEAR